MEDKINGRRAPGEERLRKGLFAIGAVGTLAAAGLAVAMLMAPSGLVTLMVAPAIVVVAAETAAIFLFAARPGATTRTALLVVGIVGMAASLCLGGLFLLVSPMGMGPQVLGIVLPVYSMILARGVGRR